MDTQCLTVMREPLSQGRPFADQRLVRHLRRVRAGRDEPGVDQPAEDRRHRLAAGALDGHELAQRDSPARVLVALTELRQAQEDRPRDLLLGIVELGVIDAVGCPRDGATDATGFGVGLEGHDVAPPPPPGLEQRVRQERQRARLLADVVEDEVDQAGRELPAAGLGGRLDGSPQLFGRHRSDVRLVLRDGAAQPIVGSQTVVEIGPQREQHGHGAVAVDRGQQVVEERHPTRLRRG